MIYVNRFVYYDGLIYRIRYQIGEDYCCDYGKCIEYLIDKHDFDYRFISDSF